MDFKHTTLTPHPLKANLWMVFCPELPFIPPYIGSKRECEKARETAEINAAKFIVENN